MTTATSLEALTVRTIELAADDPRATGNLLDLLPAGAPLAWVRGGEGMVGWGQAARLVVAGADRFDRALRWWRDLPLGVEDEVGLPGTGPVVFGSFAFADGPSPSYLVLPRVLLGRRGERTWLTTVGPGEPEPIRPEPAPPPGGRIELSEGSLSAVAWQEAVGEAMARIRSGALSKVVLARDLAGRAQAPIDVRALVRRLALRYPSCYTFAVAGLLGATPELLVRREGEHVTSRVLAGTAWDCGTEPNADARLLASAKDHEEHEYALASAAEALRPYCDRLEVPGDPTVLRLANLVHLATEVRGRLAPSARATDALSLAARLHPTAAVCGTPTDRAAALITELEGMDRGRYAGPVGWMDANGDGEWGIALRCAEVDGARLRLFAGCGIVADSDPETELAEADAKFAAVREVLEP